MPASGNSQSTWPRIYTKTPLSIIMSASKNVHALPLRSSTLLKAPLETLFYHWQKEWLQFLWGLCIIIFYSFIHFHIPYIIRQCWPVSLQKCQLSIVRYCQLEHRWPHQQLPFDKCDMLCSQKGQLGSSWSGISFIKHGWSPSCVKFIKS